VKSSGFFKPSGTHTKAQSRYFYFYFIYFLRQHRRKKIQDQRTAAGSGYFKKTSQNCRVSRNPGKEEPGRFLGGYFTFTI
jgi:hypothetical protein